MATEPPSLVKEKLIGGVLVALSALLLKWCVLDTLDAAAGGASVRVSLRGIILAPGFAFLGVCLLVLPHNSVWRFLSRPSLRNPDTQKATPLGWALIVAFFLPGLAVWAWLEMRLGKLGYR